jgi:hypothetical protein
MIIESWVNLFWPNLLKKLCANGGFWFQGHQLMVLARLIGMMDINKFPFELRIKYPTTFPIFNINYIILRNFDLNFFQIIKFCEGKY